MIKIKVCKGIPFVWDAVDWLKLRREHRIVGVFDGAEGCGWSSPIHCQLPLRLSLVETQYLISQGIAQTLHAPCLENLDTTSISQNKVSEVNKAEKSRRLKNYKCKRKMEIELYVDLAIEGKKRKGRLNIPDRETYIQQELAKIVKEPGNCSDIFLEDPWADEKDYIHYDFPLPTSPIDRLRFLVFEDFHKRKYYVTSGIKFGGDFLAYPDDPFHHHAEFIIMCQDKNRKLSNLNLVSQCRLAQVVKKTLLVAVLDEKSNKHYYLVAQQNSTKYDAAAEESLIDSGGRDLVDPRDMMHFPSESDTIINYD